MLGRARRGVWIFLVFAVSINLGGCGSDDSSNEERIAELERQLEELTAEPQVTATTVAQAESTSTAPPATSPSTTVFSVLPPVVEVEWFGVNEELQLFRFLAWITNPNDVPLTGVDVHWEAIDSSGALVGTFKQSFPAIDPGFRFPYVGGAGGAFLSGAPSRVEVVVDDPGRADVSALSPMFEITETGLGGPDPDFGSYEPYAIATSFADRAASGLRTEIVWIFRDAEGGVVGADFGSDNILPDTIPAGSRVRFGTYLFSEDKLMPAIETAASLEAHVYEDAP